MSPLTLDSQMLLNLYGGSHEDARFILNDYLDKHNEILQSFTEAFKEGNESLTRCAHRHASSFTYIGIPQLTTDCRNFELECKDASDTFLIKISFDQLLKMIDHSAVLVKEEITKLNAA